MSCDKFTVSELRKILTKNNVPGRSKYTTKSELCKVITKLALLKNAPARRPRAVSTKKRKARSAKKTLPLVYNLIHHGFIPRHRANEAQEALNYLRIVADEFPATKQCIGNGSWSKWFDYLLTQEQFHPSLKVTPMLNLLEQGDKPLRVGSDAQDLAGIKSRVAEGCNTVIPLVIRHQFGGGGHANMLLINRELKSYEWFEPNGHFSNDLIEHQSNEATKDFIKTNLKVELFLKLKAPSLLKIPSSYKFLQPYDECLYSIGPQAKANTPEHCVNGGYCLAFSTLYAHLRFLAPEAAPTATVRVLTELPKEEILHLILHYIGWQNAIGISNSLLQK